MTNNFFKKANFLVKEYANDFIFPQPTRKDDFFGVETLYFKRISKRDVICGITYIKVYPGSYDLVSQQGGINLNELVDNMNYGIEVTLFCDLNKQLDSLREDNHDPCDGLAYDRVIQVMENIRSDYVSPLQELGLTSNDYGGYPYDSRNGNPVFQLYFGNKEKPLPRSKFVEILKFVNNSKQNLKLP